MLAIGLIFLVTGIWIAWFGTQDAVAAAERAASLTPLTAASFDDQPAGALVLVEATISPRNRPTFRTFVVYHISEIKGYDEDGDPEWEVVERVTPALMLEADGVIQLANSDYTLEGELTQEDDDPALEGRESDSRRSFSGLVVGQQAMAIGTVETGLEGNELRAELLAGGSRDAYVAAKRAEARFLPIFGGLFAAVGLLMSGVALWMLLRRA
jgi:hypothetical protein